MRLLVSLLILLICISDKAQCIDCDGVWAKLFQGTGAVVTEVPVISTVVNLFNFVVGQTCIAKDVEKVVRNIAMDEDRKQEFRQSASTLKAHLLTLDEIRSYEDVKRKFSTYDQTRINMRSERLRYFDPFEHHHESKFKIFTRWGITELTLIDIMIKSKHGSDKEQLEEQYGDTLLYYIIKGSEMFSKFPLELAHDGTTYPQVERAQQVAKQAAEDLRPTLIEWIEAVE